LLRKLARDHSDRLTNEILEPPSIVLPTTPAAVTRWRSASVVSQLTWSQGTADPKAGGLVLFFSPTLA
jgi:hypothetical protein